MSEGPAFATELIDVPDSVRRAYGVEALAFGRDYIIPKPFDPRVLVREAAAVAEAAMATGVAQRPVDLAEYREALERRLGRAHEFMRQVAHRAQRRPMRVVFPEGDQDRILRACQILLDEKIGGTIHMALGAGYPDSGSTNQSAIHWDMICDLRDGGTVLVDGEPFLKDGAFTI